MRYNQNVQHLLASSLNQGDLFDTCFYMDTFENEIITQQQTCNGWACLLSIILLYKKS